jgi:hypothetical protein
MSLVAEITIRTDPLRSADEITQTIALYHDIVSKLQQAKEKSEYQVEKLLGAARK